MRRISHSIYAIASLCHIYTYASHWGQYMLRSKSTQTITEIILNVMHKLYFRLTFNSTCIAVASEIRHIKQCQIEQLKTTRSWVALHIFL